MLKYLLLLIALGYSNISTAQEVEYSLFFGANYFWLELEKPEIDTYTFGMDRGYRGYNGGISLAFKNKSKVSFAADVSFQNKRIAQQDPADVRFTFNYIAFTPKVQYQIIKGVSVNTGMSIQYLLHKKASNFFDNSESPEDDTHFSNHNLDWVGGINIRVKSVALFGQFNLGISKNIRKLLIGTPNIYTDVFAKSRMAIIGLRYTLK